MMHHEIAYQVERLLKLKETRIATAFASVAFTGFITDEHLGYEQAMQRDFRPINPGELWGSDWRYAWFRTVVRIPGEAAGKRVMLLADFGSEATVYRDGTVCGALDLQHHNVLLTRCAVPGEAIEIAAEAYAGHSGKPPRFGESSVAVFEEEAYQFFIDLECLYQVRSHIDPDSLRTAEIDRGLRDVIALADFGLSGEALAANLARCRERMQPLLACVNGSTAPLLYLMGQSHLDVAWLWPMAETKRKVARTLSNQLSLMEEYPEYRYMHSQPFLLQVAKELYPELYARVKRAVQDGRIVPEGGMWVEPDTNLTSGESLIRQIVYGKRFLKEEFGVDSRMLWLPDVFGYSGNLPQIMKGCGLDYFGSVKMFQVYENVADPFPYNTFMWEGIDGSQVLTHLLDYGDYPLQLNPSLLIRQWNDRVQKTGLATRLVQFGHGDGGGGPVRDDLEFLRRLDNLEGVPKTKHGSPIDYFEDQERRGLPEERYVGELYYPAHRGTYTTQAHLKRLNRKTEIALHEAEFWGAAANASQAAAYPYEKLEQMWKGLLLHQFHDILPGTSIHRVHQEARAELTALYDGIREWTGEALGRLTDGSPTGITVYNSMPWERRELIPLPDGAASARTHEGRPLPVQAIEGRYYAELDMPSAGWASYGLAADSTDGEGGLTKNNDELAAPQAALIVSPTLLENEYLTIRLNETGEIGSIVDKESGSEWTAGNCNVMRMYRDNPSAFDAWEIDRRYRDCELELDKQAKLTVVAAGPLLARIRVERKLCGSAMIQDIQLRRGSRRVEFHTRIDWRETNKMLRVDFPVAVHAAEALQEIQFGHVKRPTHASRPHDADRFEVSQHKWAALAESNRGFALLNDCKYGVGIRDNTMSLTLLRAPAYPDATSDQGEHRFAYGFTFWNGSFFSSPVMREAYELNYPALVAHGSSRTETQSFFELDAGHIMLETVKLAEDRTGDWIVRLYEGKGTAGTCRLTTALDVSEWRETSMTEEPTKRLEPVGNAIRLRFRPFEVKTIRLSIGKG